MSIYVVVEKRREMRCVKAGRKRKRE